MSIFAGLQSGGIKGPDVVINGDGGSLLPTSASGVRFSSAKINQTPALLSGIKPYSYGAGSTSDDISYGVVPHKIQKIVPRFCLPSYSDTIPNDNITLCHSVDDGDVAFTIRLMHDKSKRIKGWNFFAKQNITRAVDPIINLCTVNYILRGLQTHMGKNEANWIDFLQATGWPVGDDTYQIEHFRDDSPYQHRNVSMFIQDYIRPIGVVIGSENQGGQHQPGGTVDFPVDFVVTLLVDGLCDNMLNLWKRTEIKAGDDLLLALCGTSFAREHPTTHHTTEMEALSHQFSERANSGLINPKNFVFANQDTPYVLNHWAQGQITARFTGETKKLFELVPTTTSEISEAVFLSDDRRNRGMWHIGRSQIHIRGSRSAPSGSTQTFRQDTANLKGGGLVQSTIAPVWKSATRSHVIDPNQKHVDYIKELEYPDNITDLEKTTLMLWHRAKAIDETLQKHPNRSHFKPEHLAAHRAKFMSWTQPVPTTKSGLGTKRSISDMAAGPQSDEITGSSINGNSGLHQVSNIYTGSMENSDGIDELIARRSGMDVDSDITAVKPNKKQVTIKARIQRSILEPMQSMPVDDTIKDTLTETTSSMEIDGVSNESSTGTQVTRGGPGMVYARSVNATTTEAGSKPVSVARVSTKKRTVDADA